MPKLEYFYFDACPFCMLVSRVINQLNIKVEPMNIHSNEDAYNKLVNTTGRTTVPCLFIDGDPMFESADIMEWLKDNADNLEKA